jgi:hypothetical protein
MGDAKVHGFRYIDGQHQDCFSVAGTRVNGSAGFGDTLPGSGGK